MYLVVYDSRKVSALIDLVTQYFSPLPSNYKPNPMTHKRVSPFHRHTGRIIHYKCRSCNNHLTMYWQTPNLDAQPQYAISEFILHYMSYRGKGSVFWFLQNKQLASSLQAGFSLKTKYFYILEIDITLSETGLKNVSFVINSVFQFMNVFKKLSKTEYVRLWKEYIDIAYVKFHFPTSENLYTFLE